MPDHADITGQIDKLLAKVAFASREDGNIEAIIMAQIRRKCVQNEAQRFTYSTKTHKKSFFIKKTYK